MYSYNATDRGHPREQDTQVGPDLNIGYSSTFDATGLLFSGFDDCFRRFSSYGVPSYAESTNLPMIPSSMYTFMGTAKLEFLVHFTIYPGIDSTFNFVTTQENCDTITAKARTTSTWNDFFESAVGSISTVSAMPKSVHKSQATSWFLHPLFMQSKALWELLYPNMTGEITDVSNLAFLDSCDNTVALDFFSPYNLENYLEQYWDRWAPHCPMIHRPSFDVQHARSELLLVMVIAGALHSCDLEAVQRARSWLDVAEHVIFQHPFLSGVNARCPEHEEREISSREKLDMLQTALLISVLQNFEGSAESRKAIRQRQYNNVILAARAFGLDRAKHSSEVDLESGFIDWAEFIFVEELIRTCTYTFLLDTAFTIFHNCPPRLAVSELTIGCACSDYCFEAENAFDFLARVQSTHADYRRTVHLSYRELVQQVVLESRLTPETMTLGSGLTTLDLFTVISCIHSMIFCQQSSLSLTPASVRTFQTTVQNWFDAWNLRAPDLLHASTTSTITPRSNRPRSSSFTRHAGEYASLAMAKLAIFLRNHGTKSAACVAPVNEKALLDFNPENVANIVHEALALGQCF
ncbi:hypothetical protein, variant 4 [Exophiala oligosperma]|nr:hypothetical protein, variant 2 [Exophiala oligosperma]XP_016258255.1 hypothetical protein, variant 3 [Exophiala oligosperma]XP_016258256.1 hypothetical protein, variant 4 [Exophiala oligosperma]KIW38038.1 hypothetical protein, variant 2 [Exophiala oligosperma]KIW38039.1 hypothetical protein, variant 3 [Exophiala oligosperma]KIW38040.1 hypothetical protein, variant 4 [Exophiala oligosperma]